MKKETNIQMGFICLLMVIVLLMIPITINDFMKPKYDTNIQSQTWTVVNMSLLDSLTVVRNDSDEIRKIYNYQVEVTDGNQDSVIYMKKYEKVNPLDCIGDSVEIMNINIKEN